ncbi:Peptide transporter family 1 [Pseudolycoriella hygida]|uniref:Peptide transporter family 1 n=1 Tax=Pseudolycoriella hygida TaxID=35572 RepID=A0A9Q0MM94_9DIPT|nr:Peptide transporter family 1 [Pseudolycoriella hygida]
MLQAILFLFFNEKIGYDADDSTAAYHSYESLLFMFPVVGAIIADSWLGRYTTMVCMSLVAAVGSFIIAIGVIDAVGLPIK